MRPLHWALIQPDWCPQEKRKFGQRERERERPGVHTHRGKAMLGYREVTSNKPRREASEETKPANTLVLDFEPSELGEN